MSYLFINAAPIGVLTPLCQLTRLPHIPVAAFTSVVSGVRNSLNQPSAVGLNPAENQRFQNALQTFEREASSYSDGSGVIRGLDLQVPLNSLLGAWPARLNRREVDPDDLSSEYVVWEPIGSGGCSKVCLGKDRQSSRFVVVKMVDVPEGLSSLTPLFEQALRREYEILRGLRPGTGPDVIKLGTINGKLCMVMEHLQGADLERMQEELHHGFKRDSDLDGLIRIMWQTVARVAAIHDQGIVHRDVKPANFMSDEGRVRIFDFGIAAREREKAPFSGSPHFMSPESFTESHPADFARDVYALGVTFYSILTGEELPFDGESVEEITAKIVDPNFHPAPASEIFLRKHLDVVKNLGLSTEAIGKLQLLDEIIERALNRDETLRFQDAGHMLAKLEEGLRDYEFVFTPPSSGEIDIDDALANLGAV